MQAESVRRQISGSVARWEFGFVVDRSVMLNPKIQENGVKNSDKLDSASKSERLGDTNK